MKGDVTIHIESPPEHIYDLVSDITRMGEWSPECYKGEWLNGATAPAVGASFKGYNKKGWVKWSSTATVTAADRPGTFAFTTGATEWSYRISADASGGSKVTESFEEVQAPGRLRKVLYRITVGADRQGQLCEGMKATLMRVKMAAEGSAELSSRG